MSRALIVFFIFILFLDEGSLHHGFGWAETCCTQSERGQEGASSYTGEALFDWILLACEGSRTA